MSDRRPSKFNVAEAKARFSELVRKAVSGEEVIIAKDNKPLVKLVPFEEPQRPRQPGSAKGRVRVAADFDETPQDFKDYV
jgi:prevent-host-death family protein